MSPRPSMPEHRSQGRGLWSYNIRILLGNTYWLIVTPVAAAQLVLFWNMATATLFSPVRAAQTIESVAPLLGAFLCAHALAPEQAGVRELVFARPVSLGKILLVRLAVMLAFVLVVLTPALLIYQFGIKAFPLGLTLLAGLPSLLFLSVLAMSVATAARAPLLGLAAAAAYWVIDLPAGSYLNPLITLHGFADYLGNRPMSDQWPLSKLLLLVMTAALYLWNRRLLSRPPAPRRWSAALRAGAVCCFVLFCYVVSGAGYKISYGLQHERTLGYRSYLWYKQEFQLYGPLPVARLFGPAFPLYVRPSTSGPTSFSWSGSPLADRREIANMEQLVRRYPDSIWADNAAFEIARAKAREPAPAIWAVSVYQAGGGQELAELVGEDREGAAQAYQSFADRYPSSPFASLALREEAALALSLLDFQAATAGYERILRSYPSSREAHLAGLGLSALYLKAGRWKDALAAADLAAAAAPWDVRSEALLNAARVAEQSGDGPGARARYEQAHAAAKDARRFASEHRPTESGLSGGEIVLRSDLTMGTCERALAGRLKSFTPSPPPPGVTLTGRLLCQGQPVPAVRVALGVETDRSGRPSPFLQTPAAQAETGADGAYALRRVQPGVYRVAAYAYRQPRAGRPWQVAEPRLPIAVERSPLSLPDDNLVPPPARENAFRPGRAPQPGGAGATRAGGQAGGGSRSAGGRSGRVTRGGGGRGGRGGTRGEQQHGA